MSAFNLIDDPWIPVRWRGAGNSTSQVGLRQLFAESRSIADLSVTPHERISLIRLLVCIAQAAVEAPPHSDAWKRFPEDFESACNEYLGQAKVFPKFEMFGKVERFLQIASETIGVPVPVSKLFPHLATGNNPTLFDHAGGTERAEVPAKLALALLVFQNFYPLYGAGYKGKGPCVDSNMLHLLLTGECLHGWIRMNCLDAETVARHFPAGFGRPIWELDETDPKFSSNATETYLGRLVPRHRHLRISDDCANFHLEKGALSYPTFEAAIEPTATVVVRTKGKDSNRALLPAKLDRSVWRDLHSVCALRAAEDDPCGAPLVLQSHIVEFEDAANPVAKIWTGALVTDLKAKILDTVESSFTVPTRLVNSIESQLDYHAGVSLAEDLSRRLYGAVKTYASNLNQESAPTEAAQRCYWHLLDRDSRILLDLAGNPDADRRHRFGEGPSSEADLWTQAVRQALQRAYRSVCHRQTPRQFEAYAAGLRVLNPHPKKQKHVA